ncbi:hypothetical protein GGR52DRAFT_573724 [Hypoxylon sp. FL1284]|nr:hypothetical protein GGR52DRAFT_573724 [Hypoxylon sp. FL1284]
MSRVESNTEGKLRAACERCRELKNRCTRTGDVDSRCDRCERLDIDCVYATNARMGRPRCHRPTIERSGPSRSGAGVGERPPKSRRSSSFQSSGRSVHLDQADSSSEAGSATLHPMLDILDSSLIPEVMYKDIDIPMYQSDFSQHMNGSPTIENTTSAYRPAKCNVPVHGLHHQEEPESFAYPGYGLGMSQKGIGSTPSTSTSTSTGADELLRLQCRLFNLMSITNEATLREPPAVDEILVACKDLLEIIQANLTNQTQGHLSETGGPFGFAGRPASQPPGESGPGDQRRQRNQQMANCVTVLQVLTCYGYALQLLEPSIETLATRTGDLGFVSLGAFSLASQPAISSYVAVHMVLSMIHQLRDSIHLLASGFKELTSGAQRAQSFQASPSDMMDNMPTATTSSIQMAIGMVSESEALLFQRLSCFAKHPYQFQEPGP